jgi:hypothetical protein
VLYEQVITPNPDVACTPGWCLKYVQDTFGLGAVYPSAIASWNASATKHDDQDFPEGVAVPLWFSLNGNPNGHVVLRMPDGSIYSSSHPTRNTPVHHASLAALDSYYGRGTMLNYLGWTEDVEGTAVIRQQPLDGDTIVITDADNEYARWEKLGYQVRGRHLKREEFRTSAVGRTWLNAVEILSDSEEADAATHAQEVGQTAVNDDWQGQIYGLQDQLKAEQSKSVGLVNSVSDLTSKLGDANKQLVALKSQPVAPTGTGIDQATKDQISNTNSGVLWLVDAIKSIFNRK